MVQPPVGIVLPLARVTVPEPAVAVTPTQVPPKLFGVETIIAPGMVGNVSVSALDKVMVLALVLPMLMVNKVFVPVLIDAAPNVLVIVGRANTVKLAVAAAALPPALVAKAPMAILLV